MADPPDFNRIADVCLARVYEVRSKGLIAEHDVVAEQLHQVWNARGEEASRAVSQAYELGHTTGWNARGAADAQVIATALAEKTDIAPWAELRALDR